MTRKSLCWPNNIYLHTIVEPNEFSPWKKKLMTVFETLNQFPWNPKSEQPLSHLEFEITKIHLLFLLKFHVLVTLEFEFFNLFSNCSHTARTRVFEFQKRIIICTRHNGEHPWFNYIWSCLNFWQNFGPPSWVPIWKILRVIFLSVSVLIH